MFLGCDIGTGFTKAVLLNEVGIKATITIPTEADPRTAGKDAVEKILKTAGINDSELKSSAATGWGKSYFPLKSKKENLINCLVAGAGHILPSCRTLLDIGAQQTLAIAINGRGQILEYRQNDRCAGGSGRFMDIISEALGTSLENMSDLAIDAEDKVLITNQCAVFAESEVITRVNDGKPVAAILAGIVDSIGRSLITLVKRISIQDDLMISGGLAKNRALVKFLEEHLGKSIQPARPDPQLVAALGAALLAKEDYK
ncbi:MAG TPA: 2-hydroxyglutaryl-CoA dehydratase [Desulfobacteraceae bacterium]|nr:2-hydroxyglutaryl-CoA dehydratase [Desulfobacteraceae bacterium]